MEQFIVPEWRPLVWKAGVEYARLDEVNPKLKSLLDVYGKAFDDIWQYWIAGKGRYVHRAKHDWLPRRFYEKVHKY